MITETERIAAWRRRNRRKYLAQKEREYLRRKTRRKVLAEAASLTTQGDRS